MPFSYSFRAWLCAPAISAIRMLEHHINQLERKLMTALDNLRAQVERETAVTQSAVTLLQGLKSRLDDAIASGDPAAVQALSDSLGTQVDTLAAAVTANTPGDGGTGGGEG